MTDYQQMVTETEFVENNDVGDSPEAQVRRG